MSRPRRIVFEGRAYEVRPCTKNDARYPGHAYDSVEECDACAGSFGYEIVPLVMGFEATPCHERPSARVKRDLVALYNEHLDLQKESNRWSRKWEADRAFHSLCLGGLLDALAAHEKQDLPVELSGTYGGYVSVSEFGSYRGFYRDAYLGFQREEKGASTCAEIVAVIRDQMIDHTFDGYKGGTYLFTRETPVWIDIYGRGGGELIVGTLTPGYWKATVITVPADFVAKVT